MKLDGCLILALEVSLYQLCRKSKIYVSLLVKTMGHDYEEHWNYDGDLNRDAEKKSWDSSGEDGSKG